MPVCHAPSSRRLAILCTLLLVSSACGRPRPPAANSGGTAADPFDAAMRHVLQSVRHPTFVTNDKEGTRLWQQTRAFYEKRRFAAAWIEDGAPRKQMDALIAALRDADREGIDPELYGVGVLEQRRKEAGSGILSRKG